MEFLELGYALQPGTILRGEAKTYTIVGVLGKGSFGITYLAQSQIVDRNIPLTVYYAIKEHFMDSCLRDKNDDSYPLVTVTPASKKKVECYREDFVKEAQRLREICKKIDGVVRVNETFKANGTAYYVMEYLDGGTLKKKMSENEATSLVIQVAKTLHALHAENFLHLDIKPANIGMKTGNDGKKVPILIDFGISKHFDDKGNPTSNEDAKGISRGYAPREQCMGIRKFNPNIDVYALGAVLLYLLSGKDPEPVENKEEAVKQIEDLLPKGVSELTKKALIQAMNPESRERTRDMAAFVSDLTNGFVNIDKVGAEDSRKGDEVKKTKDKKKTEPLDKEKQKKKKDKGKDEKQKEDSDLNDDSVITDPLDDLENQDNDDHKEESGDGEGGGKGSNGDSDELGSDPLFPPEPKSSKVSPWALRWTIIGIGVLALVLMLAILPSKCSGGENPIDSDSLAYIQENTKEYVQELEILLPNGLMAVYTGPVDENGLPDGEGEGTDADGGHYTGIYEHGYMHGTGVYIAKDGLNRFEGVFIKDMYHDGTLTFEDGSYYEGTFDDNEGYYNGTFYNKGGKPFIKVEQGKKIPIQ